MAYRQAHNAGNLFPNEARYSERGHEQWPDLKGAILVDCPRCGSEVWMWGGAWRKRTCKGAVFYSVTLRPMSGYEVKEMMEKNERTEARKAARTAHND